MNEAEKLTNEIVQELADAPIPDELMRKPLIVLDGLWFNDTHDPLDYKCDAMAYLVACVNVPGFSYEKNVNVLHGLDDEKLEYLMKFQNNSDVGPNFTPVYDQHLENLLEHGPAGDETDLAGLKQQITSLYKEAPLLVHAKIDDIYNAFGIEDAPEVFSEDERVRSRKSVYDLTDLVK